LQLNVFEHRATKTKQSVDGVPVFAGASATPIGGGIERRFLRQGGAGLSEDQLSLKQCLPTGKPGGPEHGGWGGGPERGG
jgi:hypothetical protein